MKKSKSKKVYVVIRFSKASGGDDIDDLRVLAGIFERRAYATREEAEEALEEAVQECIEECYILGDRPEKVRVRKGQYKVMEDGRFLDGYMVAAIDVG